MSDRNVEDNMDVIRRVIAAWNANDWDAMEKLADPDIEIQAPEGWPEAGEFKGWPAVRRQYERLKEAWSEEHLAIIELQPIDEDRVLSHMHWTGHGEASGLDLDLESWNLDTIKSGRLVRTEFYLDAEQAKAAAGL